MISFKNNNDIVLKTIMIQFKKCSMFLYLFLISTISISESKLDMGWGLYRWINKDVQKFQPLSDNKIILSHPSSIGLIITISTSKPITQTYNSYNLSQYKIGDNLTTSTSTSTSTSSSTSGSGSQNNNSKHSNVGRMLLASIGGKQTLQFHHISQFHLKISCIQSTQQCLHNHDSILKQLKLKTQQLSKICHRQSQQQYICSTSTHALSLTITLPIHTDVKHTNSKINIPQQYQYHVQNLKTFMQLYNITDDSEGLKRKIVQSGISAVINQICLYQQNQDSSDDQGVYYMGFCEQGRDRKWRYNFKLAAFSIYLLADYYYQLAHRIYQDFFILVQTHLLYPSLKQSQSQVLPLVQHIQIFTRFGSVLQLQNQVQLLNSLFVTPMLNQLGTLHQQLNYRQAKKLHPLLLKMLTQKWSSSSPIRAIKSFYDQSFTQDFKYHQYGQKLQQSIAKNAWIYKVIDTFTGMLIKHHSFYMPVEQTKQHLQEHFTLLNIYKIYTNDDNNAKQGKYSDIIDVGQDTKLYGKYLGYDSLLPYVYGLGKIYPEGTVKELETEFGLKSINQKQYISGYRYRGDIHAYFNAKIVPGLMYRVDEDKNIPAAKKKEILTGLAKMANGMGKKIIDDYKKQGKIYTSWTPQGKGKEQVGWAKITAVLMLKWA